MTKSVPNHIPDTLNTQETAKTFSRDTNETYILHRRLKYSRHFRHPPDTNKTPMDWANDFSAVWWSCVELLSEKDLITYIFRVLSTESQRREARTSLMWRISKCVTATASGLVGESSLYVWDPPYQLGRLPFINFYQHSSWQDSETLHFIHHAFFKSYLPNQTIEHLPGLSLETYRCCRKDKHMYLAVIHVCLV